MTYTSAGDAQDAIDNMDLNLLLGRVIRVNLARPQKAPAIGAGNRASAYDLADRSHFSDFLFYTSFSFIRLVRCVCLFCLF